MNRLRTRSLAIIAALPIACTGATLPRAVPEDVENPIVFSVRGGTPPEITGVVIETMAALSIPLDIADRSDGEVRTRWLDVGDYIRTITDAYPNPQERVVRYHFTVQETARPRERRVEIFAGYRPFGIDRGRSRDRAVPQQHPGMQLAVRIRDRLQIALIEANMEVPRETPDTEDGPP